MGGFTRVICETTCMCARACLDLSIYLRGSFNFHLVLCVSYSLSFLNLCCVCVSLILPLGLILAHCLLPPPTLASHAVAAPPFFTTAKGLKTSSVVIILSTSLLTSGTKPRCVAGCVDVLAGVVLCFCFSLMNSCL